jgi:hypothetical protein
MLKSFCLALATVLGVAALANGVYMLVAPESWYFLLGVVRPHLRVVLWGAAAIWLSGHALFHFWEVAVGICSPSVIPRDFPAVTLPAIIGLSLTLWAIVQSRRPAMEYRQPAVTAVR